GAYTSTAIGADGLAIISYWDYDNSRVKVAHCDNTACTTPTTSTIDSLGVGGKYTSIAIGADGLAIISYQDWTQDNLKVAHCDNIACTTSTTSSIDATADQVGWWTSITIGADGLAIISYYDSSNIALKVAHCTNTACTTATTSTIDTGNVGWTTSITVGTDGLAIISYYDFTNAQLKVAHCTNAACTSHDTPSTIDTVGTVDWYSSITIGADGLAIISYADDTNGHLKVAHCANTVCSTATVSTIDNTGIDSNGIDAGATTSITIGADGLPIVSYYDVTNGHLKLAHCDTTACVSATTSSIDAAGNVGRWASIAIGVDNLPIISYYDTTNGDLKVAHVRHTAWAPHGWGR
ncbi:MAG: hypothetical protein WCI22_14590, partial [Actinomycetota bacterium]